MIPEEQAARDVVENCAHPTGNNGQEYGACVACIASALVQARREEMREHRQETGCRLTHRLKTTPWVAIRARAREQAP